MTDAFAECIDCGRPTVSAFSRLAAGRCADCFALPGWYLLHELRVVFEPDEDWQPPQRAPMASNRLVCEAHRIRLAHLFDPVLAVCTSVVGPLLYGGQSRHRPLDRLSRNEDVQSKLTVPDCRWDLIVCDEAHTMSATYFGGNGQITP